MCGGDYRSVFTSLAGRPTWGLHAVVAGEVKEHTRPRQRKKRTKRSGGRWYVVAAASHVRCMCGRARARPSLPTQREKRNVVAVGICGLPKGDLNFGAIHRTFQNGGKIQTVYGR